MKNKTVTSVLLTIVILSIATHSLAVNKTITRTEDPITIAGQELKEYLGSNPDKFALLIYKDGKFKPIPFQIDQVKADGLYALQCGDAASKDADPNLDANDELTFMINDLSDKASFLKKPINAEHCKELEVTDPVNDQKGWVYLCTYKDNPPRSEIDYVNLTFEDKYIIYNLRKKNGDKFGIFAQGKNATVADRLQRYLPNGELEDDLLDRMKFRITVKFKFIPTIKIALDGWVLAELEGWIDGPVRVITKSKTYIKFGFVKFGVNAFYNVGMYRNGIHFKVDISSTGESILTNYPSILRNSTFKIYMDLSEELLNHYVYSEHNSSSIKALLDGKTTPNEKQLDFDKSINWIAGYGERGGIMARIFVPENWNHILRTFYLNENLEKPVDPEESKGELGVGWKIAGSENIFADKGTLVVYLYYFEPDFKPPMEKDILNIHDNPVKVSIAEK